MNISIKNPSERLVERLRQRAARHNRSPDDEARVILEEALGETGGETGPAALLAELRKRGVKTRTNSTDLIRSDRDR
jgi:plasmid stability protein